MTKISQIQKDINNKEVRDSIKAQINIEMKITENSKLAKDITNLVEGIYLHISLKS